MERTIDFDFSTIDDRVDQLIEDFGGKFRSMNRGMSFNQYGSFLCDPPNPKKLVVSTVMDDMIAAVTHIPQPCRFAPMHVSTSPMVAVDSEGMPSEGFSNEKPSTKIPEIAQDSKETQAEGAQTRHPLKPTADDSKGMQDNDIHHVGPLKENVSVHRVSPIVQPRTMAEVAHDLEGTQAKARQSVGLSEENPIACQRSPAMQPQARRPLKPVSHNVSRAKAGEVADDSKGLKCNRVLSVGSSKENMTPTILPKIKGPPLPSTYNRAPQNRLEKVVPRGFQANRAPCVVSIKEYPRAHNRSATAVPQKKHPSKPPTHTISGVLDSKMAKIPHKPEGSQARDTLSMSSSKENPSARIVSSTTRPQARHSPKLVTRDPKGVQDKDIPSKGSLKENVSAHHLSPTIRPRTKCPPKAPSFTRDTDNKLEKVPPQGIEINHIPTVGSLNENPRLHFSTSSKGKEICRTSSNHSEFELKASKPQKKYCVSLGNEPSKDARLENESPKGQHSGVSEAPAPDTVATEKVNDEWVGCDICYKWRLLPYGTNTAELPNKWKCKMQTWL